MHKQQLVINHYVSDTIYCDLCRFCTKTKGGSTCLLTNQILVKDAFGILKSDKCLNCKKGVVDEELSDMQMPKVAIKNTVHQVTSHYKHYVKQGFPPELAIDMAAMDIVERMY